MKYEDDISTILCIIDTVMIPEHTAISLTSNLYIAYHRNWSDYTVGQSKTIQPETNNRVPSPQFTGLTVYTPNYSVSLFIIN